MKSSTAPGSTFADSELADNGERRARARVDLRLRDAALSATVSLRDEVAGLLSELIRLDTVNPPGNETRAAELLRAYLEGNGVACELYAKVPERANLVARIPGTRRRAAARPALAHGHGAGRSGRVAGRPVVGRAPRRRDLGPRRARHEGPGGGERRRDGVARARRVPPRRRPDLRRGGRRGGRRRLRARLALPGASRRGSGRVLAQRGRRRPHRDRRPAVLPRLDRREDELALRPARPRPKRPRVDARRSRTTRSSRRPR